MAGRYSGWIGKKGGAEDSVAVQVGRKLLGMLAIRRKVPGVKTLPERVVLEDGTIVEARFDGDIPRVLVIPPDDVLELVQCELYVESGMLDLGQNIAADAASRWDRGLPEFDDSPATLHFGTGVDCPEGVQGLNGRVVVSNRGRIRSGCLPSRGSAVQSRLRSPAKKQAQAVLPASTWSGLMHRYIAAVYGGQQCDYELSGTSLVVRLADDAVVIDPAAGWGLVEHNGAHAFCTTNAVDVTLYGLRFTKCAAKVYEAWRLLRDAGETSPEHLDKLLTIALSGCIPGDFIDSISRDRAGKLFSESGEQANGYGYAYAKNRAMSVLYEADEGGDASIRQMRTVVEEVTFSYDHVGGWSITSDLLTDYCLVSQYGVSVNGFSLQSGHLAFEDSEYEDGGLDAPVYCYYLGEQRKVIWLTTIIQEGTDIPAWDTLSCYYPGPGSFTDGDTSTHAIDCSMVAKESKTYFTGTSVAHGMYSKVDGVADWTSVTISRAMREHVFGGSVYLRLWADSVLLRAVARTPFITDSFSESSDPRPSATTPKFWGGVVIADTIQSVADPGVDAGEGARSECTTFSYELNTVDYPPPSGFSHKYVDITSYHAAYDAISVLGDVGWKRSTVMVLPRGSRCSAVCIAYKTDGLFGAIGRSHAWSTYHYMRTAIFGNSAGDTLATYSVEANVGGETTIGTYYARASANHIWPASINATGAVGVSRSRVTGFRSYTDAEAPGGPGTVVIRDSDGRASDRGESIAFQAFSSDVHLGAGVEFSETLSGTALVDPDFDWLGTSGDLGELSCLDVLGTLLERPSVHSPITVDLPDSDEAIDYLLPGPRDSASVWYTQGNTARYVARMSLLGAMTIPRAGSVRGESINMDREDIAGGYPKVNTPSFVGWA